MTLKAGDIVVCLRDRPHGAGILKGERAKVVKVTGGSVHFINYPAGPGCWWVADVQDFKLARPLQLENK